MEKLAEKIVLEITDEQNKIFEKVNKEQFALDVSGSFESVTNALNEMKKIISDLDIKEGDIDLVETPEQKRNNDKQIKLIKTYTTPLKKTRANVNKALKAYSAGVLNNYDELLNEFGVVRNFLEEGNNVYTEKQIVFKEKEKRLIFEGIQKQFPDFTFEWDDKFINSSREVIEAELIDQMKKEKARIELLQMKESFAENKINYHSKEYSIKTEISFEAVSHLFNFEEMTNEEIDETAEKYIVSVQVIEAEAEEKETARLEAEKKQREYNKKKAKEEAEKKEREEAELKKKLEEEYKEKRIDLLFELEDCDPDMVIAGCEDMTNEALEIRLNTIKDMQKKEKEKAWLAKVEAKRIADEEKAEKERLRKEAEKGKSKTLLISVECIDKYTDDFKTELEEFLQSKAVVKKYAVKVKGE